MLAYPASRFNTTISVAIANSRLEIACDRNGVTFRWKDYRAEGRERPEGHDTSATAEFIPQILIHVLPHGFRTASATTACSPAAPCRRTTSLKARRLLDVQATPARGRGCQRCRGQRAPSHSAHPCPCCGGRMIIIERFQRGSSPRYRPTTSTAMIRIDTS